MPERKDGNKLKKIMNDPSNIVEEMLEGLVKSYPELVHRVESSRVVAKNQKAEQVGLVSGGGSGHEPSHAGFVGEGMLSAAVLGDVFTSPTPDQIQTAIKEADSGKGVLLIVKNYTGDALNFDMAKELAAMDDIEVESVIVDDDIAVENSTYTAGKRGVAGTVLVHKIVGDVARNGASLAELKELGEKVVQATKTIGLALRAATVPEVGKPGFELGEDEIEYGVGIHGEPGYRREKMQPSKVLAKELVTKILDDYSNLPKEAGVLVNGMGGTPLMEQFVFMNDVLALLEERGVNVVFRKVGNFMTSLDMQGLSLTLIDLTGTQWKDSLESNVQTISW
ncbi:dihydroxyacetone kinase subunit DhaK [Enterococcus faecium]